MIVLRVAAGIREHFPSRVTEWLMTYAILGWSAMLAANPDTFSSSPSFAELARYASQETWAAVCLGAGLLRLTALVINGTFKGFRYSPQIRAGASVVACVFWGQIALGVFIAWSATGGPGTGVIAYSTFMAIEIWNLFRAWADVGAARREG